jgi:hypothetical protein
LKVTQIRRHIATRWAAGGQRGFLGSRIEEPLYALPNLYLQAGLELTESFVSAN